MTPVEGFDWLLTNFRQYTQNELTWREVRHLLDNADMLNHQYGQLGEDQAINRFMMHMRNKLVTSLLLNCSDDYLWRRVLSRVERGQALDVAFIGMLLWLRANPC